MVRCACHRDRLDSREDSRTLPPHEVGPLLLANVRARGDEYGDLANALPDDLREALRLAAAQLEEKDTEIARMRFVMSRRWVFEGGQQGGVSMLEDFDRTNPAFLDWQRTGALGAPPPIQLHRPAEYRHVPNVT
jgi:hypothetical protein